MSMKRIYLDYIQDMLTSAEKALDFTKGMDYAQFSKDEKTHFAVIRALEIIGEAAKNVPLDLRRSYPKIAWRDIAGARNKLIHEYSGINLLVVWRTVQDDLPILVHQLTALMDDFLGE